MSLKSFFFLKFAIWKVKKELNTHNRAFYYQERMRKKLLLRDRKTLFGLEHGFRKIDNFQRFQSAIPIRTYEEYEPYINRIKRGEKNVLTKSDVLYLLMTSGTTKGVKYIPISKTGIKYQVEAALKVLCFFAFHQRNAKFINHKMIFLQGNPALDYTFSLPTGRLSGVVYHHVPRFFQKNKLPSYNANVIADWQMKLEEIVEETYRENISIMGGIPPWCLQYFEKLLVKSGKQNLRELYPNLAIYIYGGLDFTNYRKAILRLLGAGTICLQTFPASEGFFALQDRIEADDMLLLLDQGIFYEFKPFLGDSKDLLTIADVQLNTHYELVITNDSGLYRYAIGDLIQFTSLMPYRIRVVGRTSQFISAFGEHVIAHEVETAMKNASATLDLKIHDFYVSADVENRQYIWQVELANQRERINFVEFSRLLDEELGLSNIYYAHLIRGRIINNCSVKFEDKGFFQKFREKSGKIGGQNKVVRLGCDQIKL